MEIVSLAPSNTEILYSLGAGNTVKATTSLCDHPGKARRKKSIGGWSEGIKVEKVVEMDPDLALASDSLQDEVVEQLEKRGVEVLQVKPTTLEEVFESFTEIGQVVGRETEAEQLERQMRREIEELEAEARIYCEEWMEPPMVSGNWIPGLVTRMEGKYLVEEGERSREFKLDRLKDFDPEYIFLNVCGAGKNIGAHEVLERPNWQDITAVQNKDVYVIDDAFLNRPGPRLVEGAKKMAEKIN